MDFRSGEIYITPLELFKAARGSAARADIETEPVVKEDFSELNDLLREIWRLQHFPAKGEILNTPQANINSIATGLVVEEVELLAHAIDYANGLPPQQRMHIRSISR